MIKPKLKVCYIITKGVWGGAQKYVYTLATSLPKNLYDIFVITGEGEILKEKLEEKGTRVYQINGLTRDINLISEIKSFYKLYKTIKKEKPDILHLNSPKAGGLGVVVGKILRVKKIIYTVHGWTFNENRKSINKALIFLLSWITVSLCNKIILIDEKDRKQAIKMTLFNKDKFVLIKNGIDYFIIKEKDEARNEILSKIKKTKNDNLLWLGTISELHKNKGLEYTIQAISKIEIPFVFIIIGEGEERNNLENLIRKYNLENKVFLVGFLDDANQYLKSFDIFTLTSIKEGLPYTVLEAGLAGLPVIASSVGGIPDIINSGLDGILVKKTNVPEITKAIEFMIENPEERKTFGQNLQEKVKKDFSLKQMLEKTIGLYK